MLSVVNSVEQLGCLAAQQKLSTIAKILNIEDYVTPDGSYQIMIDAKALGAIGKVYDLTMDYIPSTSDQKKKLLQDIQPGGIYRVEGRYWVFAGEPICLIEPTYKRLNLAEDVIKSVFDAAEA